MTDKVCFSTMEMNIIDYTVNGACCSCGMCCSNFLPMDWQEIDRIRRYIRKHNITATISAVLYDSAEVALLDCPFRDNAKRCCKIYPVRPRICRSFQCNKEKTVLMKERTDAHLRNGGKEIDMRATFFGDKPVLEKMLGCKIA